MRTTSVRNNKSTRPSPLGSQSDGFPGKFERNNTIRKSYKTKHGYPMKATTESPCRICHAEPRFFHRSRVVSALNFSWRSAVFLLGSGWLQYVVIHGAIGDDGWKPYFTHISIYIYIVFYMYIYIYIYTSVCDI